MTADPSNDKDEVGTWASLCHFSAFLGAIWWIPTSILWVPVGHLLCPLIVWFVKRKKSPKIDWAGRESLNFQINMSAYGALGAVLLPGIAATLWLWAVALTDLYWIARAGVAASEGRFFSYPLVAWRLLRETKAIRTMRENESW
ncbi:MAG: DUF4870 domain-containing protein [Desulfosoma sp.]|uniref:DUF4870 domain-containing protein n=1 Tax=Desulfosoma sp. TaxID=2603217 RepID=UPI004049ED0A